MSLQLEKLQETIVKTAKLELNIDHLFDRVEKLCDQIDTSMPLLEKINLRMEDDILRRAASDKLLTKLADDVTQLIYIQRTHSEKISEHDNIISDLNKVAENQRSIIKGWKIGWKAFISICIGGATLWGYIENQKDERSHEAKKEERAQEVMLIMQEIDEKKKRLEYTREKYLIKNGIWKNGES